MKKPKKEQKVASASDSSETLRIPVIEEQVQIEKQLTEKDRVRIIKRIKEEKIPIDVSEFNERIEIKRVPLNQYVEELPAVRHEGHTMIIPVVHEEVVITKRYLLVEELQVTKFREETQRTEEVDIRLEEIKIERDSETNPGAVKKEK